MVTASSPEAKVSDLKPHRGADKKPPAYENDWGSPMLEFYQKQELFKAVWIFKACSSLFAGWKKKETYEIFCPRVCPAVEPGDLTSAKALWPVSSIGSRISGNTGRAACWRAPVSVGPAHLTFRTTSRPLGRMQISVGPGETGSNEAEHVFGELPFGRAVGFPCRRI